jgi:hypothetical protein
MPEAKISPNLDKIVTLLKNNLGNKTQKKSGIMHIREADMQLQLELMDGDLIIYAEFDKNWYKI